MLMAAWSIHHKAHPCVQLFASSAASTAIMLSHKHTEIFMWLKFYLALIWCPTDSTLRPLVVANIIIPKQQKFASAYIVKHGCATILRKDSLATTGSDLQTKGTSVVRHRGIARPAWRELCVHGEGSSCQG